MSRIRCPVVWFTSVIARSDRRVVLITMPTLAAAICCVLVMNTLLSVTASSKMVVASTLVV